MWFGCWFDGQVVQPGGWALVGCRCAWLLFCWNVVLLCVFVEGMLVMPVTLEAALPTLEVPKACPRPLAPSSCPVWCVGLLLLLLLLDLLSHLSTLPRCNTRERLYKYSSVRLPGASTQAEQIPGTFLIAVLAFVMKDKLKNSFTSS